MQSPQSIDASAAPLAWRLMRDLDADGLGEALRGIAFPKDGFGCYRTFDPPTDAWPLPPEARLHIWREIWHDHEDSEQYAAESVELGDGFYFQADPFTIEVVWYWDGDGTLVFRVWNGSQLLRVLENTDCKKDYCWEDVL